jgi:hypothetical protein
MLTSKVEKRERNYGGSSSQLDSMDVEGEQNLIVSSSSLSKDEEAGENKMRVLIYTTSYNVIDG